MAAAVLRKPTPRRTIVAQARAVAAWHGPARLRSIRVPTLVVHGRQDPLSPIGNGRRLAARLRHAELIELDDVGHLLPQEAPERLAELIHRHVEIVAT